MHSSVEDIPLKMYVYFSSRTWKTSLVVTLLLQEALEKIWDVADELCRGYGYMPTCRGSDACSTDGSEPPSPSEATAVLTYVKVVQVWLELKWKAWGVMQFGNL